MMSGHEVQMNLLYVQMNLLYLYKLLFSGKHNLIYLRQYSIFLFSKFGGLLCNNKKAILATVVPIVKTVVGASHNNPVPCCKYRKYSVI